MKKSLWRLMGEVCLLIVLLVWVPATQGQTIAPGEVRATFLRFSSLVIEEGYSSTSQPLATINGCDTFTLKIVSGSARFTNKAASITLKTCNTLYLPVVFPGPLGDEGYIEIASQRISRSELLRVATVERGNVAALHKMLEQDVASVLWGDHFVLVNESTLPTTDKATLCTSDLNVDADSQSGANAVNGVCIRTPLGPGKVYWRFSNPKGSGYSVKPETSNNLIWAQTLSQNIDGIYRNSWGNCNALKVPDSCTVDFYSSSYSSCCNAAMLLLGHKVRWVDTCSSSSPEASWPDAPLR